MERIQNNPQKTNLNDRIQLERNAVNDDVYLDSPCVLATFNIVRIGEQYLLFDYPQDEPLLISPVVLNDVWQEGRNVRIEVTNMITGNVEHRKYSSTHENDRCQWVLAEIEYLRRNMDRLEILDYCEKGK